MAEFSNGDSESLRSGMEGGGAPCTPPRDRSRTISFPRSSDVNATMRISIGSVESGVPIWTSDKFIPLDGTENCANFTNDTAASKSTADLNEVGKAIRKEPVPGVEGAFILHNFFSEAECENLIHAAESMGFDHAKVTTSLGMVSIPGYRSNQRVIWHTDPGQVAPLMQRLLPFLQSDEFKDQLPGWVPYALNERLRVFKYDVKQEFQKHFDGGFRRHQHDRSHMTFIAYLGKPEEGGHTGFYDRIGNFKTSVVPTAGSALLFFHEDHILSPMHSGMPVVRGIKYAVRSDIMFYKSS